MLELKKNSGVWLKGQSIGNFTDNMFNRADLILKVFLYKWKRRKVKLYLILLLKGQSIRSGY
jgi:hypothetical protein